MLNSPGGSLEGLKPLEGFLACRMFVKALRTKRGPKTPGYWRLGFAGGQTNLLNWSAIVRFDQSWLDIPRHSLESKRKGARR